MGKLEELEELKKEARSTTQNSRENCQEIWRNRATMQTIRSRKRQTLQEKTREKSTVAIKKSGRT